MNRTVASTNMNATSSRAHTIVGINFVQKFKNSAGKEMAKGAVMNLVDLAGRYAVFVYVVCSCNIKIFFNNFICSSASKATYLRNFLKLFDNKSVKKSLKLAAVFSIKKYKKNSSSPLFC